MCLSEVWAWDAVPEVPTAPWLTRTCESSTVADVFSPHGDTGFSSRVVFLKNFKLSFINHCLFKYL